MGVYYGMLLAWEYGFRQVVLELDSKIVLNMLTIEDNQLAIMVFWQKNASNYSIADGMWK